MACGTRRAALRASPPGENFACPPLVRRAEFDAPRPARERALRKSDHPGSPAIRARETGPARIPAHEFKPFARAHHARAIPGAVRSPACRAFSRLRRRITHYRAGPRTFLLGPLRPRANARRVTRMGPHGR